MPRQRITRLSSVDEFEIWRQSSPSISRRPVDQRLLKRVMRDRLTERQRELIGDYYFERLNVYEIAKLRGISPSTVSRTLKRARANIYNALEFTIHR